MQTNHATGLLAITMVTWKTFMRGAPGSGVGAMWHQHKEFRCQSSIARVPIAERQSLIKTSTLYRRARGESRYVNDVRPLKQDLQQDSRLLDATPEQPMASLEKLTRRTRAVGWANRIGLILRLTNFGKKCLRSPRAKTIQCSADESWMYGLRNMGRTQHKSGMENGGAGYLSQRVALIIRCLESQVHKVPAMVGADGTRAGISGASGSYRMSLCT